MEFQHTALRPGQIRLLKLLRGDSSKYLKCELQPVAIDSPDCPRYTAISYCSGDPSLARTIMLNQKLYRVTESVYDLLNSLMSKIKRWIWIDALCIDQNDNEEKSWQIGYMGRIYSRARLVYVWLGNEAEGSSSAVSLLKTLCLKISTLNDSRDLKKFLDSINAPQGHAKKALCRLFNRPWFFRIWVIQEVVLSTNTVMVIGKQQIPFLDLWRFISHLQRLRALRYLISGSKESFSSEIVPRAYLMIASVVALQDSLHLANTGSAASLDLEEAIMVCGKTFATDPRDNIYGIYGMFSDDLDEEQKPDYNATPEDVYVKTTKYLMLKNNSLRCCVILEYALPEGLMFHPGARENYYGSGEDEAEFRTKTTFSVARASSSPGRMFCTASGTLTANISFHTSATTATNFLTISGLILDDIVLTSNQNITVTAQTVHTAQHFRKWYLEAQLLLDTYNACTLYPAKITTDAFWQTLVVGQGHTVLDTKGTKIESPGSDMCDAFVSFQEYMTRFSEFHGLGLDKRETTYIGADTFAEVVSKATDFFEHAAGH
ncbi:heterokaryon incompatibility protein-domain-containing protein [Cadophora sp. MPI-SDFR-AT-0126]|nr:heterokaryon incompatibility protein-domain-containing protein [Leotiomycetes sp. MPI-SDFR-AT-0126]